MRQIDPAARLVARHLTLRHPPQALISTLALAVLREDAGFYAYQMLEARVRQFTVWGNTGEGRRNTPVVKPIEQWAVDNGYLRRYRMALLPCSCLHIKQIIRIPCIN
jgi:hypothetical protein